MRRRLPLGLAAVGLALAAAACVIAILAQTGDASLARLRDAGTIRIGYAIEAPYAFLDADGTVTGESPEVAGQVVARLGIRHIQWRLVEFGDLIPELEAGRIDVIAAGMFITIGRAQRVSFSEPTFHVQQGLLVRSGNPRQFHSYEQALAQAGVRIAVISGAVEEGLLRRLGASDTQLLVVPDALTGRLAVESGVADGLALSSPTVRSMALREQLGRTEVAQPFVQPRDTSQEPSGYGAFAFRRGDRQLLEAWNAVLKTYVGSQEHLELVARFGFTELDMPSSSPGPEASAR